MDSMLSAPNLMFWGPMQKCIGKDIRFPFCNKTGYGSKRFKQITLGVSEHYNQLTILDKSFYTLQCKAQIQNRLWDSHYHIEIKLIYIG